MKLADAVALLRAEVLTGQSALGLDITHGQGADLLSDVLATPRDDTILLTGLTNLQVIRTAEMLDIKAVVLVRGKRPDPDSLLLAEQLNLPLLVTDYGLFESCGILYQAGLRA
ncbi:MAG: hypothetical protein ACOX2K_03920 [Bacillota bacterium]